MPGRPLLTMAVDVDGRPCLIVGGGPVAARKMKRLLDARAVVTVVSPEAIDDISATGVRWERRPYRSSDLDGTWLVVTATGVPEVDAQVVADAAAAGVLVNDATDSTRGNVVMPAVTARGPVRVSIETRGLSPALAAWLRERIDHELDGTDALAEIMASARAALLAAGRPTDHPGWRAALDSGLLDLVRSGDLVGARAHLATHLDMG